METVGNPIPSGWFEAIKKNNNLSGWSFQPIPQKKYRSIWIISKIGINIIPICLKSPNVFLHGQSLIVHNKSKKIVSIQAWGCSHCFLVKKKNSLTSLFHGQRNIITSEKTKTAKLHQRLVTVPFWVYWTSPYSSHLVDHIPFMVGWCDPWGHLMTQASPAEDVGFWLRSYPAAGSQQLTLKTPSRGKRGKLKPQMLRIERSFPFRTFQHGHKIHRFSRDHPDQPLANFASGHAWKWPIYRWFTY